MEQNVFDVLKERGFIEQTTHEAEIRELLGKEKVTFYIGFDATADSLTAGHFLTIMAMMHMQRAGHRPIALLGGGTTMIGDPSGKSDMRNMMTKEKIDYNAKRFHEQLSRFIDFDNDKAIIANNADWLLDLNYVEFLREIGVHFSVNKMLTAECYKQRMERGLTFFEFNYMLMQSYDFLKLNQLYGCQMELGGNDQWSNILGGVDLIRRKEQKPAYGLTFKLLTTSEGIKMGKTMKGAVWLDPEKTSPYEFYQYWRNIEDVKVEECLGLLTFLPMEEVRRLFKPEFLNRIDEIMVFHPLTEKDMKQIITLLSKNLCDRCKTQMDIDLTFTSTLKDYLVKKYSDLKMGARPLKRAIQNVVEDELATAILEGRVKRGDVVHAGIKNDKITFTVKESK